MSSTDFHASDSSPTENVPVWADVFDDQATARRFVRVVSDVIEQRWGDSATFDPTVGQATMPSGCTIGFANTACELIGFDEPYWRSYLFLMLSEYDAFDPEALDRELRSWSRIRSRLRVRLYPTGADEAIDDHASLVRRPVSDSLSFILAADSDLGCVPIPAHTADEWNKPIDQAWRTAIKNTRSRTDFGVAAVKTPEASFMMLEGDLYTTGHARDLSVALPRLIGPYGALLAAPTSRALFVLPIDDPATVPGDAVGLLVAAVTYQDREPNPLSSDILWYRGPNDLVGALDVGPGIRIRNVAPEPLTSWLEPD